MLYLYTVISFFVLSLAFWLLVRGSYDGEPFGCLVFVLATLCLLLSLVVIPVNRANEVGNIQQVKALQITIDESRRDGISEFERAAMQTEIIKANAWIAKSQYWSQNKWVSVYYVREVLELEFVK